MPHQCEYINGNSLLISDESFIQNYFTWNNGNIVNKELITKFVSYIGDEFTILDIGAQSGLFSLASKFYPTTKWYSFEPDMWNRNLLIDNIKLNSINNVTVYEDALSEKVGDSILNICHSHRGLNTLGKNLKRFYKEDSFEFPVKTNTIDNLFLETKIDLIKIDTEGSEYDILLGGSKTIKKYKPKILLEYHSENLQQCGRTLEELDNFIKKINYEIIWRLDEDVFIQPK